MKISAIIINYNNDKFIEEAIRSVQKQSHPVQEIIVVDDCSTDKSIEKINGVNIPIKLIRHEKNMGPSAARNTGIKNATGEILAFLDGDDTYHKDKIKNSITYFEKYPEVGMVYTDYEVLENNNLRREFARSFDYQLLKEDCLPNSNSLIRKSVFATVGMFNESIRGAEDYEMWIRIAQKYMIIHIPEALFLYRMHGQNFTTTNASQVIKNTQGIRSAIKSS